MDRPDPAELSFDPTGRRHLLILDAAVAAPDDVALASVERWQLGMSHPTPDDLDEALAARLATARIGERLYLKGGQALLARLATLARAAGMLPEEIRQQVVEGHSRRVVCAACRRIQIAPVEAATVACACGLRLSVRRQLSPRLGACLGVPCP